MSKQTSTKYDQVNTEDTKKPVIILQVDGLPYVFASAQSYTQIRYDDPGIFYNGVYVYDGLRPIGDDKAKNYIDRKGSQANISQKLEQWDGKASVETCQIKLVDVNGLITTLLSPGIVLSEILNRKIKIFFGYQNVSYPEDYIRIFSGYINEYDANQGNVMLKFTDPSSKRKQQIFNNATTTITAAIGPTDLTIPVVSNSLLYVQVIDGAGNFDPAITTGVVIDDEIITYTNADINVNGIELNNVGRGAFGTVMAPHDIDAEVKCFIQINDNPITIALKTMLSGWNGPCFTNVLVRGIVNTDGLPPVADSITFGQGVDLVRDLGISVGDYITLSGSPYPANNATFQILSMFQDNRSVVVSPSGVLVQENPPPVTVAAFRSKYDTLPITAGLQLTTDEVDVTQHEYLRDTFIQFDFVMNQIGSEDSGKTWIETNLMKPIGGYALTQGSRVSMGLTHPPLSTDLTKIIDHTNVIKPDSITVNRGVNTRFFYNEVAFSYAYDVIKGTYNKSYTVIDEDGIKRLGDQVATLNIDVQGLPDSPASVTILRQRAQRILLRYRYSAEVVKVQTKFGTGHTIDAGDIVVLSDRKINNLEVPLLKITNTETGKRGIYDRVMEVQERSIKLSDGNTSLTLLSNLGFSFTDRYAVIAPSSVIDNVTDPNTFRVRPSFGARYGQDEFLKWKNYENLKIRVHSPDYTRDGEAVFTLDKSNQMIFNVVPALSFTPQIGDIVELASYDESSSNSQKIVKSQFTYLSYTGTVVTGLSNNVFSLQSGEGANYIPGNIIYVQSPDGDSRLSPDVKILSIIGDLVTIGAINATSAADLGFVPVTGDYMKLGGFRDGGQSYRYV